METANVAKVQVWIRMADYKVWCEKHHEDGNTDYVAFCGQCPCDFICDGNPNNFYSTYDGAMCVWIRQSCPHLVFYDEIVEFFHDDDKAAFVPLECISLTEYDNSEFAPE